MSGAGAILTGEDIKARLSELDPSRKIFITPILSEKQIGRSSIDVRLGNVFIVFRRTKYSGLDVLETSKEELASRIEEYQEKVYVPLGKKFFLHPQQLILGCTLEYVRMPNDLVAEVVGRSSWGRLGLILSAATLVHPGFAGVITLELANQDDVPIPLIPGLRIAQLVIKKTTLKGEPDTKVLKSKYLGATEPAFSLLYEDYDLVSIKKIADALK